MALLKIIGIGDELVFDLSNVDEHAMVENGISIYLVEKAGRQAVLRISAHRSIDIKHYRMVSMNHDDKNSTKDGHKGG